MDLIWLVPAASLGLVALAVPVLIHLLTDRQTRHIPFPTLRFFRRTRLAAARRRSVQNWWLLTVRLLILATAVAALAGPVVVSDGRHEEWRRRVARAVVVAPGDAAANTLDRLIAGERSDSFASEVFRPSARVADGLRDAALWLQRQAPASHEVVVVGDLKAGAIVPDDVTLVPARAGLRFLPLPSSQATREVDFHFQEGDALWRARTTLQDSSTRVSYSRVGTAGQALTVRAAANDQAAADAALNAVRARGVDADATGHRRVVVVFEGGSTQGLGLAAPAPETWMRDALAALPEASGGASGDVLVVETTRRASDREAAHLLERIARAVFATDRSPLEPAPVAAAMLAQWSRPPGALERGRPGDEGDRRWLWAAALVLLAIEAMIRRRRSASGEAHDLQEPRVA